MIIYIKKYENIMYKNFNRNQINADVNTIGSKILDIKQVFCWSHSKENVT